VNGVPTPVSVGNPLPAVLTKFAGGTVNFTVTGVTIDATNVSESPDGISGSLTVPALTGAYVPVAGDYVVAANAPKIYRPGGVLGTNALNLTSVLSMQLLLAMKTGQRNNAVPTLPDGTYVVISPPSAMQELYADQDFKLLYQGREDSDVFQDGFFIKLLGLHFVETTEAYIEQSSLTLGSGSVGTNAAVLAGSPGNVVLRPIMVGADAIVQGHFEMMSKYLEMQDAPNHKVIVVDHVAQIMRAALDRLAQLFTASWFWGGGFTVPTDITATTTIIPTASSALYKRAAVAEIVA
jgi:hypothetical protein